MMPLASGTWPIASRGNEQPLRASSPVWEVQCRASADQLPLPAGLRGGLAWPPWREAAPLCPVTRPDNREFPIVGVGASARLRASKGDACSCAVLALQPWLRENQPKGAFDRAVVDINLHGKKCYPIADTPAVRIPLVFATGYGSAAIDAAYASYPRCAKRFNRQALIAALIGA